MPNKYNNDNPLNRVNTGQYGFSICNNFNSNSCTTSYAEARGAITTVLQAKDNYRKSLIFSHQFPLV